MARRLRVDARGRDRRTRRPPRGPRGELVSAVSRVPDIDDLERVADLLSRRNDIDADLGGIIARPMTTANLGTWIAARIFAIDLGDTAAPSIDGHFTTGPLARRSVGVKWYPKRSGSLDMPKANAVDFYLVLCGPSEQPPPAAGRANAPRPWRIDSVHLFDAHARHASLTSRGVRAGTATVVRPDEWSLSEVYPRPNKGIPLTVEQQSALARFAF